jgi:hypothetical protein
MKSIKYKSLLSKKIQKNSKLKNKKTKHTKHTKHTKPKSYKNNKSMDIDLDFTDKSLLDFRNEKSISVATTESDIKSSKIGELYSVKPIHDNIQRLCHLKVQGKALKEDKEPMPKQVSKSLCECLFEKNQGLRIVDLEKMVKSRMDTPASSCIHILDKYKLKRKSSKSSKSSRSVTSRKSL